MSGKRPKPKYQVFVSSTFGDLQDEREAVTWEILKANHIPVGMESFPASDDRGWKTIQRAIDRSDYYVLIVAGMYGSLDQATGKSWTQREYEYATSKGVPVLAFLRDEKTTTANWVEREPAKMRLLNEFKGVLKDAHLLETWQHKADLGGRVVHALRHQIDLDKEGATPRPGWFRGDEVPTGFAVEEFARLSAQNAELREALALAQTSRAEFTLVDSRGDTIAAQRSGTARTIEVDFDEGADDKRLLKYLEFCRRVRWVRFHLSNSGGAPARNVIANFLISGVQSILWGPVTLDLFQSGLLPEVAPQDPTGVARVTKNEVSEEGVAWIQQRLQIVGATHTEGLLPFAVVLKKQPSEKGYRYKISYNVLGENGENLVGELEEIVSYGAPERLFADEARAFTIP